MVGFLAYALKSADVPAALRTCDVGMGEYLQARRSDPAFGLACVELDLVVRAAAVATLEAAAAQGVANTGKLKLLLAGIEQLRTFAGDGPGEPTAGLPLDAPAWLPDLVARICGATPDLVILAAVESAYLSAVEWVKAHPGGSPYDFAGPGPCEGCLQGLALVCPDPRCATPILARDESSDRPRPAGRRWEDYELVTAVPADSEERAAGEVLEDLEDAEGDD